MLARLRLALLTLVPLRLAAILLIVLPALGQPLAADRTILLAASEELAADGFLHYILPRFSLKTGIRVVQTDQAAATVDIRIGSREALGTGQPVFEREGTIYLYLLARRASGPDRTRHAESLANWLSSTVAAETIAAFNGNGKPRYVALAVPRTPTPERPPDGDAAAGKTLAYTRCGRCHVVGPANRTGGLGSTPSFRVLRTFDDWQDRFRSFYALNPHPSFTQIAGITEAFNENHPPPIAPLHITLRQLDAIIAYVATIAAADLGQPIRHQ